ncbi:hypothetical protein B0T14DRAFT_206221 [Immersiella caudata]|uniref:Uncharacterized protein n=1 Tax=Immersiella caudata TaxID=314043 RepID=A0AA39WPR0_9PEZI|nr:hypothetical protein B0T14DRAFT_206221 [Immersiella caudata]
MAKDRARDTSGKKIEESKKSSDDRVKKPKDKESKLRKEKKVQETRRGARQGGRSYAVSAAVTPKAEDKVKSEPAKEFIALDSDDNKATANKPQKEKRAKKKATTATTEPKTEAPIQTNKKPWQPKKLEAKERVRTGKEKKAAKEAAKEQGRPLFVLNVGRAKKKEEEAKADSGSSSEDDPDDDSDGNSDAGNNPAGAAALAAEEAEIKAKALPRPERRELILIARQKYKIMKRLGLDLTVKGLHPEVDEELQKWVEKRKEAHYQIERRRQERKKKAARRMRKLIGRKEKCTEKLKKGKARAEKKAAKAAKAST